MAWSERSERSASFKYRPFVLEGDHARSQFYMAMLPEKWSEWDETWELSFWEHCPGPEYAFSEKRQL